MSDIESAPSLGTVIVIDDEETICSGCKLVLTDHGYTVDTYLRGRAGLDAIRRENYDLVLLDLKLPDMNGMDGLKEIHRDKPEMNVIIMTGYASVQNAVDAMRGGAFDYISKPFSDDELILAVKKAIQNKRLIEENLALRKQLFKKFNFSNIVGENSEFTSLFHKIGKAAPTDTTILLEGESGTGKELFANAIHAHSNRASKQFIVVDCSTFSSSLLESELFGHVKGAFTGALKNKPGVIEIANGGTLFLDEISNLSLEVQGKLLRTMETRQYKPVGGDHIKSSDMRIIAATNHDLKSMVESGQFRKDLFYRLYVLPIYIPPLRERKDDIPKLAYHFLRLFSKEMGRRIHGFSDDALDAMIQYDWPGNVRQLKNVVERLIIMCDDDVLCYRHLSNNLQLGTHKHHGTIPETLAELKAVKRAIINENYVSIEKAFLLKALKNADWNITRAGRQVGMQRSNFSSLMKKHHVSVNS
jgi:two-component system, NtrC family, response regulator